MLMMYTVVAASSTSYRIRMSPECNRSTPVAPHATVFADGDGAVALPGLGHELTQMCLGRSQRIRRVVTVTPGTDHRGQQRSQHAYGHSEGQARVP